MICYDGTLYRVYSQGVALWKNHEPLGVLIGELNSADFVIVLETSGKDYGYVRVLSRLGIGWTDQFFLTFWDV